MNNQKQTILSGVLLLSGALSAAAATSQQPNIIYILVDDLGQGDLGCYGGEKIMTPCIDRMSEEGMKFTNHYCGNSVSGPSRTSLLSGKHMGHATIRSLVSFAANGRVDIPNGELLVSKELQSAGYSTAVIGKWGLSEVADNLESMPLNRGFDYFYGYRTHAEAHSYYPEYLWRNNEKEMIEGNDPQKREGQYSHDLFANEALDYIKRSNDGDKPFFLFLTFTIPHYELTVPEESKRPYENLGWTKRKMSTNGHYRNDEEGNVTYAGMVSRMDGDVGRLLDLLRELNIDDNTIVFFASDNGPEYDNNNFLKSNGGLRGGKRTLYEGGIHTPMIAWSPGTIERGTQNSMISAFWDFYPTACDIAGVKPSAAAQLDGVSLLPTLTGNDKGQQQHKYLYWEINQRTGPIQAVRSGDWKLVRYFNDPAELYNLKSDSFETTDVAEQNPRIVRSLLKIIDKARVDNPDFPIDRYVVDKPQLRKK